jgi:hypothetical protein
MVNPNGITARQLAALLLALPEDQLDLPVASAEEERLLDVREPGLAYRNRRNQNKIWAGCPNASLVEPVIEI